MRCSGRHLALFVFLCGTLFSAAPSFSDCASSQPAYRFYADPYYIATSPYIYNLGVVRFYSFSFDIAGSELVDDSLALSDGAYYISFIPLDDRKEFSGIARTLDNASQSFESAKGWKALAHALSQGAHTQAKAMLGLDASQSLFAPFPLSILSPRDWTLLLASLIGYVGDYPPLLNAEFASASDAFDGANLAILQTAAKADEKYGALRMAGAGLARYSGMAKEPFLAAASSLSASSQLCSRLAQADSIRGYFASRPAMPNFRTSDFSGYLSLAAGRSQDSSVISLAKQYAALSRAFSGMESEYAVAHSQAKESLAGLSNEIGLLSGERLDLMGDALQFPPGTQAQAGSSFGGIYGGLLSSQDSLSRAKLGLSQAERLSSSRNVEGYLADAITRAESSHGISQAALVSLRLVRSNAIRAVGLSREAAQEAISRAQDELPPQSSPAGVETAQSAQRLLGMAQEKFDSAGHQNALGERYASYLRAAELAFAAQSAIAKKPSLFGRDEAQRSLSSLASLVSKAAADGVDMSYQKQKLAELKSFLANADSSEAYVAISRAAKDEEEGVLLLLSDEYSSLNSDYSALQTGVSSVREFELNFLPEADSLVQFFPQGKLDTGKAAGSLAAISKAIARFKSQLEANTPRFLSSLLSQNARAYETVEPPVLGRPTRYAATIFTTNPSATGHGGKIAFTAKTTIPLYSSEKTRGEAITDAYPTEAGTTITLPSVAAGQSFSIGFEKQESPAQITSSRDSCGMAQSGGARSSRTIAFFASRSLGSLLIDEQVPGIAASPEISFNGRHGALSASPNVSSTILLGALSNIPQGKNSLEITYTLQNPFALSQGERSAAPSQSGKSAIAYQLALSEVLLDCDSAAVEIFEPYSGISSFRATPPPGYRIANAASLPTGASTKLQFTISPLRKGQMASIQISYEMEDSESAYQSALSQVGLQILTYKRQEDADRLSVAQALHSQNKTALALTMLSSIISDGQKLSLSYLDMPAYEQENASASELLSQLSQSRGALMEANATIPSGKLAIVSDALYRAANQAALLSKDGDYKKAATSLQKAQDSARGDLASLAFSASKEAAAQFSKSRPSLDSETAAHLESGLQQAQSLFAQGKHLPSFEASSLLLASLSASASQEASLSEEFNNLSSSFTSLKSETAELLSNYSSQYSSLLSQTKKRLPSPSSFEAKIGESEKLLSAAKKKPARQALEDANSSIAKLEAVKGAIIASQASLQSSAESSLEVARAALGEASRKAGATNPDVLQIEAEVGRSQDYLSNSLYADSIASSDRAIRAANNLLSSAGKQLDIGTIAIGALSLAFIGGAAYYFLRRAPRKEKEEKKELPKEIGEKTN